VPERPCWTTTPCTPPRQTMACLRFRRLSVHVVEPEIVGEIVARNEAGEPSTALSGGNYSSLGSRCVMRMGESVETFRSRFSSDVALLQP
jgi:hypothetical protein